MTFRIVAMWAMVLIILGWVNYRIYQNERAIAAGEPIFLELAPADPRALIQGDYMTLRYKIAREIERDDLPSRGRLILTLDDQNIVQAARLETEPSDLAAHERRLNYRQRDGQVYLGAESFFFQEGQASLYAEARYAELRLSPNGTSILVGLWGPELESLE